MRINNVYKKIGVDNMLKKTAAIFLSIVILFSLGAPAFAASNGLDEELARVTEKVKKTLGVDNSYTKFTGDVNDRGTYRNWSLNWQGDNGTLNVMADSTGKILYFYRYKNENYTRGSDYSPAFPKASREDALPVAKAFVEKLLSNGETALFDENNNMVYGARNVSAFNFSGTILLNGLKSPIAFSVRVMADGMEVNSFSRSDAHMRVATSIPSSQPAFSSEKADVLLQGTVSMKLQYVFSDDGKTAVLQYLPIRKGNYVVKADTGELVDITPTYDFGYAKGMGGGSDRAQAVAVSAPSLSEVELSAVSSLEGVYSKEKIDSNLRSVSGLGLDSGFTLKSARYSTDSENGKIYCQLNYMKKISDEALIKEQYPDYYGYAGKSPESSPLSIYKYITVDAKTLELKYVETSTSAGDNEKSVLSEEALEKKASAFLESNLGDKYKKSALNKEDSDSATARFVYSEMVNGIPFPQNSLNISVSKYDGTVKSLYTSWKDGVEFASSEGIVGADAAKTEYLSSFKPVLQYIQVPTDKDGEGYSLILAYRHESDENVSGVDAKTGKAIIVPEGVNNPALAYDDIEGCYGKAQIEALAKYGIGFTGTSFKPEAALTQKDALILLLSATGYSSDGKDEASLYEVAYKYRLLTRSEKNPDSVLTRAALIKMLIGATEYAPSAKLKGVFVCGFSDDADISEEHYGYVAIAKALGVVKGDSENRFNPYLQVARQDAAIILYNFMAR